MYIMYSINYIYYKIFKKHHNNWWEIEKIANQSQYHLHHYLHLQNQTPHHLPVFCPTRNPFTLFIQLHRIDKRLFLVICILWYSALKIWCTCFLEYLDLVKRWFSLSLETIFLSRIMTVPAIHSAFSCTLFSLFCRFSIKLFCLSLWWSTPVFLHACSPLPVSLAILCKNLWSSSAVNFASMNSCVFPSLGPQPYEAQAHPQPRLRPRLWLENF